MKRNNRYRLKPDELEILQKYRAQTLDNFNDNTALDIHLAERGIDKKDVVSVKHWQNMGGELRFSVVTKEGKDDKAIFKKVTTYVKEHAPIYKPIVRKNNGEYLLVINPADVHIGKYANETETGDGYTTDLAVRRVLEGVQGLIDKSQGFRIDRVLLCLGNDILHVDNVYNTTTKGTHQDTDGGKWWEFYEIALELYVKVIETLRLVAPVDCVHSMSNHDYQSGYYLAQTLKAWFRNTDDVNIVAGTSHRKYYHYGNSLIGLEHGDGAKVDNLPLLMAQESPQLWAKTKFRYWYLHHLHHKIKYKYRDAKDFIGVTVEYLRSPSGSDSWHARKGFKGVPKAVEGFIHCKKLGQIARLTHYF
jgi:hypothetical protein